MGQLLSLENVTLAVEKENSNQAIVKHVSFSISEGEIVALVGESGSGKSVSLSDLSLLEIQTSAKSGISTIP